MNRELTLPQELAQWIATHMPRAPELARVRIFCGKTLPFDALPGFKPYIGVTLWNRIYLREPFDFEREGNLELLFHKLVHVRQFQAQPLWFPVKYLWFLCVRGYQDHPAEIEARADAAETMANFQNRL